MKKYQAIFISLLLLFNCIKMPNDNAEYNEEVSIIAILYSNVAKQRIYLYYTSGIDERSNYKFVTDAKVEVYNNQQNINFRHKIDTTASYDNFIGQYYTNYPAVPCIHPNMNYSLSVTTEDGLNLSGCTTVPAEFNIIFPTDKMVLKENMNLDILVKWRKSKNSYGYLINLLDPPSEFYNYYFRTSYYGRSCHSYATSDTAYTIYEDWIKLKKGKYTIKVMAYDRNFHDHYFSSIDKSGINGGYGVFASAALDSVDFYVE